jgi:hypothetical protein
MSRSNSINLREPQSAHDVPASHVSASRVRGAVRIPCILLTLVAFATAPLTAQTSVGASRPAPADRSATTVRRGPDTLSTIGGEVSDSVGRPLAGVELYVVTSGRSTRTDANGRYLLHNVIEGPTQVRARRVGLRPVDTAFVLQARANMTLNMVLDSRPLALDTVRVTASQDDCPPRSFEGFSCRRKAGVGVFRDSAELAALHPQTIADMFEGVRGLRREGGGVVAVTHWRCLTVLINGHLPLPSEVHGYGSAAWIAGIAAEEFYEDGDTAPSWYRVFASRRATPCSLIVYWTRNAR